MRVRHGENQRPVRIVGSSNSVSMEERTWRELGIVREDF